jgi:hypothetical protein
MGQPVQCRSVDDGHPWLLQDGRTTDSAGSRGDWSHCVHTIAGSSENCARRQTIAQQLWLLLLVTNDRVGRSDGTCGGRRRSRLICLLIAQIYFYYLRIGAGNWGCDDRYSRRH